MSKHNKLYSVVVYIGDIHSHTTKTLYQSTKLSEAERYVAEYIRANPNCSKIYIEHTTMNHFDKRRMYDDED